MKLLWFVEGGVAFFAALIIGTLTEYIVHRLMHGRIVLYKTHAQHHQADDGQGWLGEFWDYFRGALLIMWIGFPYSLAAGIGFLIGGLAYAAMAAYAHQVQHENPELVFWLPRPVHHLHHKHHMWKHNFGILVDIWDRVFGTYKKVDWKPEKRPFQYPLRSFFQIRWIK